jgi:hypothetical protein
MRCGQAKGEYHFDHGCGVRLCEDCMVYCMTVTTDKERPVTLTCDKNHVLNYLTEEEDYEDTCCKCAKEKPIKLACIHC